MIYLDHSSTTPPSGAALRAMNEAAALWGNPSSVHTVGREAAALLLDCREKVARALGLPKFHDGKLLFTSCGTESNNLAILGCADAKKRDPEKPGTVLLSAGEHPSVSGPADLLGKRGYAVERIPTRGGTLDLGALEAVLDAAESEGRPVVVAAFMLVNNETGALYDVKAAAEMTKKYFPDALVHCDAVQGFLKTGFTPAKLGADSLTVSAHKVGGIRGAAALYLSETVIRRRLVVPVMPGGGQEDGFRSGTEALVPIAAFAAAAEEGRLAFEERRKTAEELRARLETLLAPMESLGVRINRPVNGIPDIISVKAGRMRSETVLNDLSGRGICVSAGSACSARSKKKSEALSAFGLSAEEADSVIRVSLSHLNTPEEIDAFAAALEEILRTRQAKR